jgi:hypothetical protein
VLPRRQPATPTQGHHRHDTPHFSSQIPHRRSFCCGCYCISTRPGPHGRSAGSASWAGFLNGYFWIDPVKHVTGAIFTQMLPFYDEGVVNLFGKFEEGL